MWKTFDIISFISYLLSFLRLDSLFNTAYNVCMNKGNPNIRLYSHLGGKKILEQRGKNYFKEMIKKRWANERSKKSTKKNKNESI